MHQQQHSRNSEKTRAETNKGRNKMAEKTKEKDRDPREFDERVTRRASCMSKSSRSFWFGSNKEQKQEKPDAKTTTCVARNGARTHKTKNERVKKTAALSGIQN